MSLGTERILIDTGPLVALLDRNDSYHEVCVEHARNLPDFVYTCWPVITEACYLLQSRPDLVERLLDACHDGIYQILSLDDSDSSEIRFTSLCELLIRYAHPVNPPFTWRVKRKPTRAGGTKYSPAEVHTSCLPLDDYTAMGGRHHSYEWANPGSNSL